MGSKPRVYKIQVQPGSSRTVTMAVKNVLTSHTLRTVTLAVQEAYALGRQDRNHSRQEALEAGMALGQASSQKQQVHDPDHGDHFGH